MKKFKSRNKEVNRNYINSDQSLWWNFKIKRKRRRKKLWTFQMMNKKVLNKIEVIQELSLLKLIDLLPQYTESILSWVKCQQILQSLQFFMPFLNFKETLLSKWSKSNKIYLRYKGWWQIVGICIGRNRMNWLS